MSCEAEWAAVSLEARLEHFGQQGLGPWSLWSGRSYGVSHNKIIMIIYYIL